MPRIYLVPQQRFIEAHKKDNLLQLLHEHEIPVGSACGGNGLCASCKVLVLEGRDKLTRPNDREIELSMRNNLQKEERISCQSKVLGDIKITTDYWDPEDHGTSTKEDE